jgi:hypothetical protein
MIFLNFCLLLWVIFALLDPDPIRIRIRTTARKGKCLMQEILTPKSSIFPEMFIKCHRKTKKRRSEDNCRFPQKHKKNLRFNSSLEDAVDELVAWTVAVAVLVQLTEEVLDAGLLVVVELEVALPPLLPVEVLHLLQLLKE